MSWDCQKEKLLCLIVLDDSVALRVSERAGPAFFRAFIVQDRSTGKVKARFRYRYKDPDEKSWYVIDPPENEDLGHSVERFKAGLKLVLDEAGRRMGFNLPDDAVMFFEPPDDGGDGSKTILWLEEQDLIEITEVRVDEEGAC